MAKKGGKICPSAVNEKNFLIEVPDDAVIIIIIPNTKTTKTRRKNMTSLL